MERRSCRPKSCQQSRLNCNVSCLFLARAIQPRLEPWWQSRAWAGRHKISYNPSRAHGSWTSNVLSRSSVLSMNQQQLQARFITCAKSAVKCTLTGRTWVSPGRSCVGRSDEDPGDSGGIFIIILSSICVEAWNHCAATVRLCGGLRRWFSSIKCRVLL